MTSRDTTFRTRIRFNLIHLGLFVYFSRVGSGNLFHVGHDKLVYFTIEPFLIQKIVHVLLLPSPVGTDHEGNMGAHPWTIVAHLF